MAIRNSHNIRPRLNAYEDDDDLEDVESQVSGEDAPDMDEDMEDDDESEVDGADEGEAFEQQINTVSFGALKEAHDSISRKRKREPESTHDQEEKLAALRQRLQHIREQKALSSDRSDKKYAANSAVKRTRFTQDDEDSEDSDDSDSPPSEEDVPKSRTSKHAPAAQSSKYQVSRKRTVVEVPKRVVRDPRFDALHQASSHPGDSDKAYSFLRDYQKSEIAELKSAMKKAKTDEDKELLKRKIGSMENRIKSKEAKERQQDIIRKHRKEERELIKQGKTPYYLKKKDIKEKALTEKFKDMKSKDREKLIERRRRKEGQKEKKRMPDARRMVG